MLLGLFEISGLVSNFTHVNDVTKHIVVCGHKQKFQTIHTELGSCSREDKFGGSKKKCFSVRNSVIVKADCRGHDRHDPEGLLDRPRQLPRAGIQIVEDKVYSVIFQSVDILLMVIHYDQHSPSRFTKSMPSPIGVCHET